MTIVEAIKKAAENAGFKRVYFGSMEDMVNALNSESKANIENQPAVFFLDEFRMKYDKGICSSSIDILLTVYGSDKDRPEQRQERNYFYVLPRLRERFLAELEKLPCTISASTSSEWMRSKVGKAFGIGSQGSKVFNHSLDGWEMILEYTTDLKNC